MKTFRFGDLVLVGDAECTVESWMGGCSFDEYDISGVFNPTQLKVSYECGRTTWVSSAAVVKLTAEAV